MSPEQRKRQIRAEALARRQGQPSKDEFSRLICRRFAGLPEYAAAGTVMFYVDVGSEVRTHDLLRTALEENRRTVVPYCHAGQLHGFRLESMDELAPGTLDIPEPRGSLRSRSEKKVDVAEIDLIMVPGVAFDRRGARLGHGKSYYDRFLPQVRGDAVLVALAFECQMFPEIPMLKHDVYMDKVITEKALYRSARPRVRLTE